MDFMNRLLAPDLLKSLVMHGPSTALTLDPEIAAAFWFLTFIRTYRQLMPRGLMLEIHFNVQIIDDRDDDAGQRLVVDPHLVPFDDIENDA